MHKFSSTLFLFFALCATVGTFAQTAQDPWAALKAKDFTAAFVGLQPLAEKGDAEAQERLGWMYKNGEGTAKDVAQSLAWFRKAADQGTCYQLKSCSRIPHRG